MTNSRNCFTLRKLSRLRRLSSRDDSARMVGAPGLDGRLSFTYCGGHGIAAIEITPGEAGESRVIQPRRWILLPQQLVRRAPPRRRVHQVMQLAQRLPA